jgi:hypothetical protein
VKPADIFGESGGIGIQLKNRPAQRLLHRAIYFLSKNKGRQPTLPDE